MWITECISSITNALGALIDVKLCSRPSRHRSTRLVLRILRSLCTSTVLEFSQQNGKQFHNRTCEEGCNVDLIISIQRNLLVEMNCCSRHCIIILFNAFQRYTLSFRIINVHHILPT